MAWTDPRTWTDGELVTAAIMNPHVRDNLNALGPHLLVRKTADETLTSNITLQNDDQLVTPSIAANEVWLIQFKLMYTGANGTGDIKFALTFPSGRVDFYGLGPDAAGNWTTNTIISSTTSPTTAVVMNARGTTTRVFTTIEGVFANGGTPGALQLQWAQNTSSATATTVYANSTLYGVKLA